MATAKKTKLSIEKIIQIDNVLQQIESIVFDGIDTNIKIADMREETEKAIKQFNRLREKEVDKHATTMTVVDGKREGVDYVMVSKSSYRVPMLKKDFDEFSAKLERRKDESLEINCYEFTMKEFELDTIEKDENGKEKKVRKNQVSAAFIRIMRPFLTDVMEKSKLVKA